MCFISKFSVILGLFECIIISEEMCHQGRLTPLQCLFVITKASKRLGGNK